MCKIYFLPTVYYTFVLLFIIRFKSAQIHVWFLMFIFCIKCTTFYRYMYKKN